MNSSGFCFILFCYSDNIVGRNVCFCFLILNFSPAIVLDFQNFEGGSAFDGIKNLGICGCCIADIYPGRSFALHIIRRYGVIDSRIYHINWRRGGLRLQILSNTRHFRNDSRFRLRFADNNITWSCCDTKYEKTNGDRH